MITEFELRVLRRDFRLPYGAAVNAAIESLRGGGWINDSGNPTRKGAKLLGEIQTVRSAGFEPTYLHSITFKRPKTDLWCAINGYGWMFYRGDKCIWNDTNLPQWVYK